jgi:hypothetical protein
MPFIFSILIKLYPKTQVFSGYETFDTSNISALLNPWKTCDIRFISAIMGAKTIPTILPPIISGNYGCGEGIKFKRTA